MKYTDGVLYTVKKIGNHTVSTKCLDPEDSEVLMESHLVPGNILLCNLKKMVR